MLGLPSSHDERGSLELVARLKSGDGRAWDELYARYHDQLLLAVRTRLGPGLRRFLQSEDILQSVALEAFRDLDGFEYRGKGSLDRFLHTLVLNKIRDRADTFRAEKRDGGVRLDERIAESLASSGSEGPRYHDEQGYERLERCLEALPAELREVLLLRKVEGLSSKEVAERLGRSDDSVRKAYSRAVARLTALLASARASEPPAGARS